MGKREIVLVISFIAVLISIPSFLQHARWFIIGDVRSMIVQNRWDIVLLNIFLFLIFLLPLNFRKRINWKSMGIYTAFIVSLFIEMYGVPLTIYMTSSVLSSGGTPPAQDPIFTITLLGQTLLMTFWKLVGAFISIAGMLTVILGWTTLYRRSEEKDLVVSGIYKYSRHPQYLGIILISVGWFIHWPSLLTMLMLPVLIYFYYQLTKDEELELEKELEDPSEYRDYKDNTPRFI